MSNTKPWFELNPKRLDNELSAFERFGYVVEIDATEKAAGRLTLTVEGKFDNENYKLTIRYPDAYPYFAGNVDCLDFPPGRHKDPYSGNLCLLKDSQTLWETRTLMAEFISEQIPKILLAHKNPDAASDIEANEGTQTTGQIPNYPNTVVLLDDWKIPDDQFYGTLKLGAKKGTDPNEARACVLEVNDCKDKLLASTNQKLGSFFSHQTFKGRWVRLAAPPANFSDEKILSEAISIWPEIRQPKFNGGPDIVGLVFKEETAYRQLEDTWLFVVRIKKFENRQLKHAWFTVRADRADHATVQARVQRLTPLAAKKVLIVGLGSIGSMFAWQLARAGIGKLALMDFDHLQMGNAPRWLLGLSAAGADKSLLLSGFLSQEYPYLEIEPYHHQIGRQAPDEKNSDRTVLHRALSDCDLVIDATAEWCVSHYLSSITKEGNIPYLWATGTYGSRGGVVGRTIPGKTGCWKCFQHHMSEGSIPKPPSEDIPPLQPAGCFHPTFPGTGFDMDIVTTQAVRLAVATLCKGHENAYPDFDWDIGVLSNWDDQGNPIASAWQSFPLTRHANCDC